MQINNKKPLYKINSCLEKIRHQTYRICNQPSYHTICNKPIVNRNLLTHDDYLYMLSTPKGYKWTGLDTYYKKFSFIKGYTQKLKADKQWNEYATEKFSPNLEHKSQIFHWKQNEKYKNYNYESIKWNQQKMNYEKGRSTENKIKKKNQHNEQNRKIFYDILDEHLKDINIFKSKNRQLMPKNILLKYQQSKSSNSYKTKNYFKNGNNILIKINNENTAEKLKNIKEKNKTNYSMKKKPLRLPSENKNGKEKESSTSLQAKQKYLTRTDRQHNTYTSKTNGYKKRDDLYNRDNILIKKNNENTTEKLKNIKEQNKKNYYMKKKPLRLPSENKNEKEKESSTSLQIEKNYSTRDDKQNNKYTSNTDEYNKKDDLYNRNNISNQSDEENSKEKLQKLKMQEEADYILKKKRQLWLLSEKRRKKREEKEKKFKSSLQAKKKANEELKKQIEDMTKLKAQRKKKLEEEHRQQKIEKEKKESLKKQAMVKKEVLEKRAKLRKEAQKTLKLEAIKVEAKKIVEEEEAWRNKINKEYAQKMGYKMDPNNHLLSILPDIINNNEYSMRKPGKERFIKYTNQILEKLYNKRLVFDPGNLMKQIIKKELNEALNRLVKLKKRIETYHGDSHNQRKKPQPIKMHEEKEEISKNSIVFKKHYKLKDIMNHQYLNSQVQIKSFQHCTSFKHANKTKCIAPKVHCYSNTSFNTNVEYWRNEVSNMMENIRKRRNNFEQNTKIDIIKKY